MGEENGVNVLDGSTMDNDERRIAEYNLLEARTHSDSNVGYILITTLMALSVAMFSIVGSIMIDSPSITYGMAFLSMLIAIVSMMALIMGSWVQERFNRAGKIRIARCTVLEEELGIFQFRLFEPNGFGNEKWKVRFFEVLNEGRINNRGFGFCDKNDARPISDSESDKNVVNWRDWFKQYPRVSETYILFVLMMGALWWSFIVLIFYETSMFQTTLDESFRRLLFIIVGIVGIPISIVIVHWFISNRPMNILKNIYRILRKKK